MSLNVQSLPSKHEKLCTFIHELLKNDVTIDVIAVQEIWQIQNSNTIQIPGFNFFHKARAFSRGGGVGFYVNENLSAKIIENLSSFHEKIFESLTIEISHKNQKTLSSNIYRSASPNANLIGNFCEKLETLLSSLNQFNSQSLVFLDSNINLQQILGWEIILTQLLTMGFFN